MELAIHGIAEVDVGQVSGPSTETVELALIALLDAQAKFSGSPTFTDSVPFRLFTVRVAVGAGTGKIVKVNED